MKTIDIVRKYSATCRSAKDISITTGIPLGTVKTYLSALAIRLEGSGSKTKRHVEANPFSYTRESMYWIGYLAADGNVSSKTNTISVVSKDVEHILRFKQFCGTAGTYYRPNGVVTIYFSSYSTKRFLIDLGITPSKSKTLKLLCPLTWDIFRGVFDGDGSYRFRKQSGAELHITTASLEFAKQLQEFLRSEDIRASIRQKGLGIYGVYASTSGCRKIYLNMYNNTDLYLPRKKAVMGTSLEIGTVKPGELLENPNW